ncbi:hypothetical protein ILYODFUR_000568 [Ilyodon furcidens]|uniref:Uncharacterized protein n=1 Tax=Ilyodon furcidens TaxID=33524 RepID=A0ABV0U2U3_9TELE
MENLIFTAEIQNHCPENERCGLLMYINENVFNGGVLILIYDRIQKQFACTTACVVLFEAEIQVGGTGWPVCHGEPAKPGPKFFFFFFFSFFACFCFFSVYQNHFGSVHCSEFRTH